MENFTSDSSFETGRRATGSVFMYFKNKSLICKETEYYLTNLESQYAGRLTIGQVDLDQNPDLGLKFGISGVPTSMIFKNGEVTALHMGPLKPLDLQNFIEKNL